MSTQQRCNHCMAVFDEALTECPKCGKDDALVYPFVDVGMKMRLTIDVDYDGDISEKECRRLLKAAAEHLSSDGWVASAAYEVKKIGGWKTVPEEDVRLVYRCKDCQTEYHVAPGEASIPYCTEDGCANAECDTDFEKVEVRT